MRNIRDVEREYADGIENVIGFVQETLGAAIDGKDHAEDVAAALISLSPTLPIAIIILSAAGERAAGLEIVKSAVERLRADDPEIFRGPPSREQHASLLARANHGNFISRLPEHVQAYLLGHAERAGRVAARREAYELRAILKARKAATVEPPVAAPDAVEGVADVSALIVESAA